VSTPLVVSCYILYLVYFMLCSCNVALVWQLMKAYTLSILTKLANTGHPIVDKEIVEWVNTKVRKLDPISCICSSTIIVSSHFVLLQNCYSVNLLLNTFKEVYLP